MGKKTTSDTAKEKSKIDVKKLSSMQHKELRCVKHEGKKQTNQPTWETQHRMKEA